MAKLQRVESPVLTLYNSTNLQIFLRHFLSKKLSRKTIKNGVTMTHDDHHKSTSGAALQGLSRTGKKPLPNSVTRQFRNDKTIFQGPPQAGAAIGLAR
ncbi:hypothetical protein [Parathalassolituus penaei]|uniref:Uncharacterized protein n=1 Tax=Parathalassolituus penaei TaxID=2997323 RepID=A0A9X3EEU3_9GAMM|nr:hypothetical protein [Parathalassolituus penaei]MCY0966252.1 hypothetical protein [Parathalassolituus penaei]